MPRIWSALILFLAGLAPAAVAQTARELVGTWELVSRIQRDSSGRVIPDSSLGAAPIGILVYDATGHVAVQLMKRQRRAASCAVTAKADRNNLAQIGGYDAYFGHYEVNPATHTVTHHLEAAIGPGDVGRASHASSTSRVTPSRSSFGPAGRAINGCAPSCGTG